MLLATSALVGIALAPAPTVAQTVTVPGDNATYANAGAINGTAGSAVVVGQVAIAADSDAVASNSGGGNGAAGIAFTGSGGTATNSGTVDGGGGGPVAVGALAVAAGGNAAVINAGGGDGAAGIVFAGPGGTVTNSGTVAGGGGGSLTVAPIAVSAGGNAAVTNVGGGDGAAGIVFAGPGGTVTNSATIAGGGGGSVAVAPIAVSAGGNATVTNAGGGDGAAGIAFAGPGGIVANTGIVAGGGGGNVDVAPIANASGGGDATITDAGGGNGGAGIAFTGSGGTVTNEGLVTGGNGGDGAAGTTAVVNGGNVTLSNNGGGVGGAGVSFAASGGTVTNFGIITGGDGGAGGQATVTGAAASSGTGNGGGAGGTGVSFAGPGAKFVNQGIVLGGNGGAAGAGFGDSGTFGTGGVGVVINGGRIDNRGGSIFGGFADAGAGPQAYAIRLDSGVNYVGTGGVISGGIGVLGNSVFQPALRNTRPGAEPLTINGPLTFASTSTYRVRVGVNQADRVLVNGVATPGGATVNVARAPAAVKPGLTRYLIVNASGGVDGRFGALTGGSLFIRPVALSYPDANNVFLTTRKLPYAFAALTMNQIAVAGGLDAANRIASNRTGQGAKILGALNVLTNATQYRAVLDSLSGEGVTAAQNIAFRSAQLFTSSIFDQTTFYANGGGANSITLTEPQPGFVALAPERTLAAARDGQPVRELADLPASRVTPAFVAPARTWRAWATGFGGVEHISGNAFPIGSATQNNSIYGGVLGIDYQLLPNYLVGVALGGSNGDFRVPGRLTAGSTTGGHVAIYDIATFGAFYGASSTSFSYFGNKTNRTVGGFGGLGNETERGTFDSHEFRTRLEFGRHFAGPLGLGGAGVLTPFVALELAELRSNGFTETSTQGAGLFRLNVSGQSQASVPAFVGLRLQRPTVLGNGIAFSPTLQVAYVHEFAPYRAQTGTLADLPGSTFLVDGARPARDAAQVKAGAELAIGPRSVIFANFDGEFSGVNQLYAGKGGFRYTW